MDNFSEAAFSPNRLVSTRIAQFLRLTIVVLLFGGVMYAAALVAHEQQRVTPTPIATAQQ